MTQDSFNQPTPDMPTTDKPSLDHKDVVFLGVLGGISKYYNLNISQLRVAYAIASLFFFNFLLVLYFVLYGLIRAKVSFPKINLPQERTSGNIIIGITIVLMGFGLIFNYLFPWLNFGFMIAVVLVLFGIHILKHKQLR